MFNVRLCNECRQVRGIGNSCKIYMSLFILHEYVTTIIQYNVNFNMYINLDIDGYTHLVDSPK